MMLGTVKQRHEGLTRCGDMHVVVINPMKTRKRSSSRVECFQKTIFAFSWWCRSVEDNGYRDLPSRPPVHADEGDRIVLAAKQQKEEEGAKPRWCVKLGYAVAPTCLYRERLLGLRRPTTKSISISITCWACSKKKVEKGAVHLRGKRSWISVDYSCSWCVVVPKPRRREEASLRVFFSSLIHTLACRLFNLIS